MISSDTENVTLAKVIVAAAVVDRMLRALSTVDRPTQSPASTPDEAPSGDECHDDRDCGEEEEAGAQLLGQRAHSLDGARGACGRRHDDSLFMRSRSTSMW